MLVFPELSLTGCALNLADGLAFAERDACLSPLLELAAAFKMTLTVGAPVRIGPRLYIGAVILGTAGISARSNNPSDRW